MKSTHLKVIHKVGGKPIVNYVVDAVLELNTRQIFLIVGHQQDRIQNITAYAHPTYVEQAEQKGTGHAVMQVMPHLETQPDQTVLVLAGDCPLITSETLDQLLKSHTEKKAAATILSAKIEIPGAYGRILRSPEGELLGIREAKDCTSAQLSINEINSGIYCFRSHLLCESLKKLKPQNAQKEYYLTDVIEILKEDGHLVQASCSSNSEEVHGINTRQDLARVNQLLYDRNADYFMTNGVSILDPKSTFIDRSAQIGADTTVHPFTIIRGHTVIGKECEIGSHSVLENATIPDGVQVPPYTVSPCYGIPMSC